MTALASGDMTGKTVVITGANSGIGFEASLELARLGALVVMVSRDRQRGETAREAVAAVAKTPPVLLIADLLSQASIRSLAVDLHDRLDHIDVLINNAGGTYSKRELNADGLETTFATNHIAPFLLTHLTLDLLKAAPAGRVVAVASEIHSRKLDLTNLQGEKHFSFLGAYRASKTANILFTNELARRLAGTPITAIAVSPGPSKTRGGDNMTGLGGAFNKVMKRMPFFHSAAAGAKVVVFAASSPDLDGISGRFYMNNKERKSKAVTHDRDLAARLWGISARLSNLEVSM
jgi:NAD(P)-dependent dehydrogenase (short-subunit alcohol dehydrogenase family)